MNVGELQDKLAYLDHFLSTENLRPEQYQPLAKLRDDVAARLRTKWRQVLKKGLWQEIERRNPNVFLGEKLTGGPRNIPGSEGGGVVIQPEETPGTYIRDFVPNTSWGDRMIMSPDRPRRWRYRGI